MTVPSTGSTPPSLRTGVLARAPFLHSGEDGRTIFLVTFASACAPLAAGMVFFGWRAAWVAAVAVGGCAGLEWVYYRVTRSPALADRSHAWLTGILLALTLPPFVPWYVPLVAAAFAIIVGKGIFGGVGHFVWQPALVGRLAVAVLFASAAPMNPPRWPLLARGDAVVGDVRSHQRPEEYRGWLETPPPGEADAYLLPRPSDVLDGLTSTPQPAYSGLAHVRTDIPGARPSLLQKLPPLRDLFYGARPGGIGETCAILIVVAGLYLMRRGYVKPHLPLAMLISAWWVLAAAPVQLQGPYETVRRVWWPLFSEGLPVGWTYVNYQLLSGEFLLATFFLATEMTTRPVTAGGQVIFGVGCGIAAILLRLYTPVPIPAYMAVLGMNTLTPAIEALARPRVFGQTRIGWLRGRGRTGPVKRGKRR